MQRRLLAPLPPLRLCARASWRLLRVTIRLRRHGFKRTRDWLLSQRPQETRAADIEHRDRCIAQYRRAVRISAALALVRPTCLARSLTLWALLHEAGITSRLCFGATRGREGLLAHCWLEINRQVINDEPDIAKRFPQLAEVHREQTGSNDQRRMPGRNSRGVR